MFGRKEANILVVKADSLAGFIAAEPAFAAIREAHPKSKISLLTTGPLQRVARASSYFDQVAGIPNLRDADARKEFVKQLKLAKFEKVYDLAGNDASKKLQSAMGPFGPKWFSASTPSRRRDAKAGLFAPLPDVGALASNAGIEVEGAFARFALGAECAQRFSEHETVMVRHIWPVWVVIAKPERS